MNEERILRKLVSASRGDAPPLIDVTDRVLGDLAITRRGRDLLLWMSAAVSSAAAALITFAALRVSLAQSDPFGDFLESIVAVIQ